MCSRFARKKVCSMFTKSVLGVISAPIVMHMPRFSCNMSTPKRKWDRQKPQCAARKIHKFVLHNTSLTRWNRLAYPCLEYRRWNRKYELDNLRSLPLTKKQELWGMETMEWWESSLGLLLPLLKLKLRSPLVADRIFKMSSFMTCKIKFFKNV